ncbi:hypothetical protein WI25_03970 [Burkholderia cepacia]|nr:hypothetical protein WI25_03970 [Burkholderia cepacia]
MGVTIFGQQINCCPWRLWRLDGKPDVGAVQACACGLVVRDLDSLDLVSFHVDYSRLDCAQYPAVERLSFNEYVLQCNACIEQDNVGVLATADQYSVFVER